MRKNRKNIIIIICAVVLILLALSALDVRLHVVSYAVSDARIETPVRIVLITDLHSCRYGAHQKELIDAIDAQHPDLIMLDGDIFDDELPIDNTITVLEDLSARYTCFYVSGNHEYRRTDTGMLFDTLRDLNISILHGSCETVSVGKTALNICGVADTDGVLDFETGKEIKDAPNVPMEEQLKSATTEAKNGLYTVLLAHRPERIETYAQYGFDLVLSGHAHGGQVRIPGILNGLLSPGEHWFPKYAGGESHLESTTLIVSRGLARESTLLPRIWNRPELVVIDLLPENSSTKDV